MTDIIKKLERVPEGLPHVYKVAQLAIAEIKRLQAAGDYFLVENTRLNARALADPRLKEQDCHSCDGTGIEFELDTQREYSCPKCKAGKLPPTHVVVSVELLNIVLEAAQEDANATRRQAPNMGPTKEAKYLIEADDLEKTIAMLEAVKP